MNEGVPGTPPSPIGPSVSGLSTGKDGNKLPPKRHRDFRRSIITRGDGEGQGNSPKSQSVTSTDRSVCWKTRNKGVDILIISYYHCGWNILFLIFLRLQSVAKTFVRYSYRITSHTHTRTRGFQVDSKYVSVL